MTVGAARRSAPLRGKARGSTTRVRRVGLAALAAVSLLLSACVSEAGGDSDSATFVYAAVGAPSTLDVWTTYEGRPSETNGFEWGSTLVEWAEASSGCETLAAASTNLRGNLAESWDYSADKSQLLIKLRSGVKSIAGNELTAEDVVWSLERAAELSSIAKFFMHSVAQFDKKQPFEVADDHTVAVKVDTPTALDMAVFTWGQLSILDSTEIKKHATESDPWGNNWLKEHLATFGPWQLKSFTPGQEVVYTPNPNYWNQKNRGNIDQLVYRSVPDASTRLQLLESGEVDYAERLTFEQYQRVDDSGTAQLKNCVSPYRDTLMLNQKFEPFADERVRQAISQAIDRGALVDAVYRGFATSAETGISNVYWKPGPGNEGFTYDPDNAKRLLSAAGVDNLSFAIMASPSRPGAYTQSLAIQIQNMLKQVGVTAQIEVVAGAAEFADDYFKGKYSAMIYGEAPAIGDPFYSANLYNSTASFQNSFGYHNETYDALTKQIQVAAPGPERDGLVSEISDLVVQTVPQAYLADTRYVHALGKSISGFNNNPSGSLMIYRMSKGS